MKRPYDTTNPLYCVGTDDGVPPGRVTTCTVWYNKKTQTYNRRVVILQMRRPFLDPGGEVEEDVGVPSKVHVRIFD